jgi:hypothetical protein
MRNLDSKKIFFITRQKSNMAYKVIETYEIQEKDEGLILEYVDIL